MDFHLIKELIIPRILSHTSLGTLCHTSPHTCSGIAPRTWWSTPVRMKSDILDPAYNCTKLAAELVLFRTWVEGPHIAEGRRCKRPQKG